VIARIVTFAGACFVFLAGQGERRMANFLRDTRFGFRLLRKNPGFAAVAIFALALGIGANTARGSPVCYSVALPRGERRA
jgi:hypothetical protein